MRTIGDVIYRTTSRREGFIRSGVLILAGSMFVAICAKIQIPGPLPMTMQTFAVVLVGAILGSHRGALAMLAYLMEGAAGLPVFARPDAGPIYFAGPTTGYLIGFIIAAFVVGSLAERGWDRRFWTAALAFVFGNAIILALGCIWLTPQIGLTASLSHGVGVFLVGDLLKILLAAVVLPAGWRLVGGLDPSAGPH